MPDDSQRLSASLEDYLEAILLISEEKGEARSKDLIEFLNVRGASVTEAFQQLADRKLINYVPYAAITLTKEGETIAKDVYHRHSTLRTFFTDILHIDAESADSGACMVEHGVSTKVIERMVLYTKYLKQLQAENRCPDNFAEWHTLNETKESK